MIKSESMKMKLNWIKIIKEWSLSCNVKKVQFFLKFANFYCRFIKSYFKIAALLHELIKSAKKEEWKSSFTLIDTAKNTFDTFKVKFTSALLLAHFNFNKQIHIELDTSDVVVIIIISQLMNDELWHSIVYWSHKIQRSETQYDTHDCELLAIVTAFKHWKHYLEDLTHSVKVLSDHVNLRFFIMIKHLNRCQTQWAEVLNVYDFVLLHWLSKLNSADVLSCYTNYVNFYHDKILLFILQQKLHHKIQKDWKFKFNDIEKMLLVCVKAHNFSLKCANDEKCSLY